MTFTNTDSVEYIIFWPKEDMVDDNWATQVGWKMYVQINPIKSKIHQEKNK